MPNKSIRDTVLPIVSSPHSFHLTNTQKFKNKDIRARRTTSDRERKEMDIDQETPRFSSRAVYDIAALSRV
jgi:hypothetical protein